MAKKIEGKSFCEATWSASAYIPVVGTIAQAAFLALALGILVANKTLKEHRTLCAMLGLRVALTLAPPLLFAIDMITTITQACINKKEQKQMLQHPII